jgi:hypothetical protein
MYSSSLCGLNSEVKWEERKLDVQYVLFRYHEDVLKELNA